MTTFFTFVGIAFTAIFAGIVLLLLSIWLYNFAKEAYVGIKVVLFLNDEWNELIKRGMTQPKPTMARIKETVKFYCRVFGNFQTTRFTSRLGNVFDWTV